MLMMNMQDKGVTPGIYLPPGFRFHPTDDELITCYLTRKVLNNRFAAHAIAEIDLNKFEPWDLPEKANMGEKEWYFFSLRDRKYPTGMRTNRATEAGYWKATGKDRDVRISTTSSPSASTAAAAFGLSCALSSNSLVGMKKTLVFYKGRAPRGVKSNWVMHEYRLEGKTAHLYGSRASKEEWVVCRIFQKKQLPAKRSNSTASGEDAQVDSYYSDAPSSPIVVQNPSEFDISAATSRTPNDQLSSSQEQEDNKPSNQQGSFWNSSLKNFMGSNSMMYPPLLDTDFLPPLLNNNRVSHSMLVLRSCKTEPFVDFADNNNNSSSSTMSAVAGEAGSGNISYDQQQTLCGMNSGSEQGFNDLLFNGLLADLSSSNSAYY